MNQIVDIKNFLRSTRESGYRNLTSALAELVDNSIEAGASSIYIELPTDQQTRSDWRISITDDGCGMDTTTLGTCLQFGGSSRFDSRAGLGRFGMGLPNSSLSQARRAEVLSWRESDCVIKVVLDIDEILAMPGPVVHLSVEDVSLSAFSPLSTTGTSVRWSGLDREVPRSWQSEHLKVRKALGRIFRHSIRQGLSIKVNGIDVSEIDPLLLRATGDNRLAEAYGDGLEIDASALVANGGRRAKIQVRFSLLDVHTLAGLNAENKRSLGIVGGAGVSIVRAGREIDYRWAFVGKRKENYDEWWRCEVCFDPVLDEAFGVTNTKQGIRPTDALKSLLTPSITAVAKVLNAKTRTAHAEAAALRRVPETVAANHVEKILKLEAGQVRKDRLPTSSNVRLDVAKLASSALLEVNQETERGCVILNENHPFFGVFYRPLTEGVLSRDEVVRGLDLLLLAIGHHRSGLSSDLDSLLRLYFRSGK